MDDIARKAAFADLYALPGHLLWRSAAHVTREVDRVLPGHLDVHAYAVLVGLGDQEPQSQRSLAAMVGVSGTTLTAVAHTLQADDLVQRVRNPRDRRSYSLSRTTSGRAAVRRWEPHLLRLEERLTSAFTPTSALRLRELLLLVAGDDLDARTPQALLHSTGFLITKAHQRTHRDFAAALTPLGIEPRHFGTLRALRIVGPATQGEVAALLDVSPATVVQIVDHLETRGLVARERDTLDRRAYRLHLSTEAEGVVARAGELSATLLDDRFDEPQGRDRRDLLHLLQLLLTATGG